MEEKKVKIVFLLMSYCGCIVVQLLSSPNTGPTVPRNFLARTKETQGEVDGQQQTHNLVNNGQSQLSLAPSFFMLQVNQGLHKWTPGQDIAKGLQ